MDDDDTYFKSKKVRTSIRSIYIHVELSSPYVTYICEILDIGQNNIFSKKYVKKMLYNYIRCIIR